MEPGQAGSISRAPEAGPLSGRDVAAGTGAWGSAEPSAPPLELAHAGAGSSGAGDPNFPALSPPPNYGTFQGEESVLHISAEEAKAALVQFAASKCCYSAAPAEHMVVQSVTAFNTYRYRLQTFTESRRALPARQPYRGEPVAAAGAPPEPWDVAVEPPPPFVACETRLPLPHTETVQACPDCSGSGLTPCSACRGSGKKTCLFCWGSGRYEAQGSFPSHCPHCGGSGQMRCLSCQGRARRPCARCDARGLLLCRTELCVAWDTHVEEFVAEPSAGFPTAQLRDVSGTRLLRHEGSTVSAAALPAPVARGARCCLARHRMLLSPEMRICRQEQTVELIPLTRVQYEWRGRAYVFHVCGSERRVLAEEYPGARCGCCRCCCRLL